MTSKCIWNLWKDYVHVVYERPLASEETTTFEPEEPIVKPKYFQAYEFSDLVAKIQENETGEDTTESNEAEPSDRIVSCIQSFLACLSEENNLVDLAEKAGKCYFQFQSCSGSAILIPDGVWFLCRITIPYDTT